MLIFIISLGACSLAENSEYDLAVDKEYQLQRQQIAEFERKRAREELSSWQ